MKKSYRERMNLDEGFDAEVDVMADGFGDVAEVHFEDAKVVGSELDDEIVGDISDELDADLIEEGDLEDLEEEVTGTNDPVRMYLMQMGQIPLLTRQEEISSARQIERTRSRYRHWMLGTDFMLQGATKLLEQFATANCVWIARSKSA